METGTISRGIGLAPGLALKFLQLGDSFFVSSTRTALLPLACREELAMVEVQSSTSGRRHHPLEGRVNLGETWYSLGETQVESTMTGVVARCMRLDRSRWVLSNHPIRPVDRTRSLRTARRT
jgi:hypothetical protein